jgi:transposase
MSHELPPWEAVYQQTRRWLSAGVFEDMVHDLRVLLRLSQRKASEPKTALLDSRTPVWANLARLGVRWERTKRCISSPNPEYQIERAARPIDEDDGQRSRLLGSRFL